LRPGGN